MTRSHCRCMKAVELGSNHPVDQDIQKVDSQEVVGAHADPFPILSGHFRYPVAPGCVPFVARPAVSAPWLLAGCCRHNLRGHPWHRHSYGPCPAPWYRRGYGNGAQRGLLRLFFCDHRGSSRDVSGHHSRDRSHCERCCSTRHQSLRNIYGNIIVAVQI